MTTLEEVFLKVASDAADHKNLGHLGRLRRESSYVSETSRANQGDGHTGGTKVSSDHRN